MRNHLRKHWIRLFSSIVALGLAYWTWTAYQSLDTAFQELVNPISIYIPTVIPIQSTATYLPSFPDGPHALVWQPGDNGLYTTDGRRTFYLSEDGIWLPVVPQEIYIQLQENAQLKQDENDDWILVDETEYIRYRWNSSAWMWETQVETFTETEEELENNVYIVKIDNGTTDELLAKKDEELLAIAPDLNPEVYNIDSAILSVSEVLRRGNQPGGAPYLLYTDQDGHVRMAWNIEKGELEHVAESIYIEKQSGFSVRVILVTDNSILMEGEIWYDLNEASNELLAKNIINYPLAINNMVNNHDRELTQLLGVSKMWDVREKIQKSSKYQIQTFQTQARKLLIDDIQSFSEEDILKIRIGSYQIIVDTKHSLVIMIRIQYESDKICSADTSRLCINILRGVNNDVEINVNMRGFIRESQYYPGGILVALLRHMTYYGAPDTYVNEITSRDLRSTTDKMVFDLCGEEIISNYMQTLGEPFLQRDIVPMVDYVNTPLPVCIIEEKH